MVNLPLLTVLSNRSFLYLWLAQVASQLAGNLLNFVLLLRIAQLTQSNTIASLFVIAISLPAFFFGGIAGVYVDHSEKKSVLFYCNLLRVVAVFGFLLTAETTLWIFVLAVVISIITQFFVPAEASLIPEYVKKNQLLGANGLFTLTFYSLVIVGFMLAGPLLVAIGANGVFLLCALFFLIATAFVGFLPGKNSWSSLQHIHLVRGKLFQLITNWQGLVKRMLVQLKEGYDYIKENGKISEAIFIMAWVQILIATMSAIAPGYADTVLKLEITDASLYIVGPAVAGMIVGSIIVGILGNLWAVKKMITGGVILSGVFLSVLSFLSRGKYSEIFADSNNFLGFDILHLAMFFLFALGVSSSIVTVSANTVLQETQMHIRSRVYGFLTAAAGLGSVFPVLAAGILSDLLGVVKVMLVMGFGILLFGLARLFRK